MKIYIASRYQSEAKYVADVVERAGHTVTSSWVKEKNYGSIISPQGKRKASGIDLREIDAADCVVLLTQPKNEFTTGGRHVEFGYGLARGKRLFVIGERENIFHFLDAVECVRNVRTLVRRLKWVSK